MQVLCGTSLGFAYGYKRLSKQSTLNENQITLALLQRSCQWMPWEVLIDAPWAKNLPHFAAIETYCVFVEYLVRLAMQGGVKPYEERQGMLA